MNNAEQWRKISDAAKNQKFSFIVGDFNYNSLKKNAFVYDDQHKKYYDELKENYTPLIDEDIITNNQTVAGIDNVFVCNDLSNKYSISVSVLDYCFVEKIKEYEYKFRYSDHNLCICEFKE